MVSKQYPYQTVFKLCAIPQSTTSIIPQFIWRITQSALQFYGLVISENSRKLYVADLANDIHCNFLPEALMNTVSSYETAYWLE